MSEHRRWYSSSASSAPPGVWEEIVRNVSEEQLSEIFDTDPERMTGRCKDCALWERQSVDGEPMDYGQCTLVVDWHQTPSERGKLRKPLILLNSDLPYEPLLITPEGYGCLEFKGMRSSE